MTLNKKNQNQLGENNNGKKMEDIRTRLSVLFSGIDFDIIIGEELINLGKEIINNGEMIIETESIVQLSEQIKGEIEEVILGNITRNIKLHKRGKTTKSLILEQDNNELKQVPIILEELFNHLWNATIYESYYIGTQIKIVGERLIEIGKKHK